MYVQYGYATVHGLTYHVFASITNISCELVYKLIKQAEMGDCPYFQTANKSLKVVPVECWHTFIKTYFMVFS